MIKNFERYRRETARLLLLIISMFLSFSICSAESNDLSQRKNLPKAYITANDKVMVVYESRSILRVVDLGMLLYPMKEAKYLGMDKRYDDEATFEWIAISNCVMFGSNELLLYSNSCNSYIAVKNIWSDPQIHYIIGEKEYWEEYGFDMYTIELIGSKKSLNKESRVYQIKVEDTSLNYFVLSAYTNNRFTIEKEYTLQVNLFQGHAMIVIP